MEAFSHQQTCQIETLELTDITNQMDLTYYTKEYNNFSGPHGTFSKTEQILWYKASLNSYKKIDTRHPMWPPWIKAGFQQQKTYKLMKKEQLSTE